jgi:hypothetical protein
MDAFVESQKGKLEALSSNMVMITVRSALVLVGIEEIAQDVSEELRRQTPQARCGGHDGCRASR